MTRDKGSPLWPPSDPAAQAFSPGTATIAGREYVVLSSNDYLGLAADPRVRAAASSAIEQYGVGSRAARTLGGDTIVHRQLEDELAAFKSAEAALLFSSGYSCNVGVISTLAGPGDAILSDRLNHASIVDGARLSGAAIQIYSHVNVDDLEGKLAQVDPKRRTLIVTDTIFSMDGDLAPVEKIVSVAKSHETMVLLDDAHATGVLGKYGQGSTGVFESAKSADAIVGTLGKALGSIGAYVAGSCSLIGELSETARSFLFTTALPPSAAAAALEALRIMKSEPERIETLWKNSARLHTGLAELGFAVPAKPSPIMAVQLGTAERAETAARGLRENGILVHAVTPPYVPPSTARLRLIMSSALSSSQVDRCLDGFAEIAAPLGLR